MKSTGYPPPPTPCHTATTHDYHPPFTSGCSPKSLIAVAVATVLSAAASPYALAAETIVINNILVDQNDPSANYNYPQNDYKIKFNGAKMDPASISVEGNQLDATINSLLISDSDVNFNWTSNILYGIKGTANSTINITTNDITFKSYDSKARNLYGFHANNSKLNLNANNGSVTIDLSKTKENQPDGYANGPSDGTSIIRSENSSTIEVNASEEILLKFNSNKRENGIYGLFNDNSTINLAADGKLTIDVEGTNTNTPPGTTITAIRSANQPSADDTKNNISLEVTGNIDSIGGPTIDIRASGTGYNAVRAVETNNSDFQASAQYGNITITANNDDRGVAYALHLTKSKNSTILANTGDITIKSSVGNESTLSGSSIGVWTNNSKLSIKGKTISFNNSNNSSHDSAYSYSIYSNSTGEMIVEEGSENLEIVTSSLSKNSYSIYNEGSTIDLNLSNTVDITTDNCGIYSTKAGKTEVTAESIEISAGTTTEEGFGNGTALLALKGANTTLTAEDGNTLRGIVGAKENNTNVSISTAKNYNFISAYGSRAGYDADHLPSAVYATEGGNVTIDAGNGINLVQAEFNTLGGNPDVNDIERAVWARSGGTINIKGQTFVAASHAALDEDGQVVDENHLSGGLGVALAAGYVEENLLESGELPAPTEFSTVNLNYQRTSQIVGDVVSAYSGKLSVSPQTEGSTLILYGNALAGNGGQLDVNLGENGVWIGRSDDYGDAGLQSLADNGHQEFFSPVFSHSIVQGGQVNVTMGSNSVWRVNGQSWLTTLQTADNAENVVVDMVSANTDRNQSAHALTIYKLSGDVTFSMSLDGNRDVSDMLYIKHAEGEVNIDVVDSVSTEDMFREGFDGLRFATVGKGSTASFRAYTLHEGALNVEYQVEAEAYDATAVDENNAYNGTALDTEKPGSDNVDQFFGYEENTGIVTADAALNDAQTEETPGVQDTTNYKLVGRKGETLSDAGQTIFATARATYWNAVVLDRWNQRYGERTYDQNRSGVWARVKHERLGTDAGVGDFRSYNTMYQFGYDYTKPTQNGRMIWGGAIDYMDGRTDYKSIEGDGGTDRTELSLYATYLADSGFYGDLVVRAGRLSSDFEMYTAKGVKLDVDYDNWLYGLSFETGRQLTNNSGWFVEPQLQAQYIRITSGDYTTQQNTRVEQDDIDSLIGRAGFRIGKFLANDKSSVGYFKADVLREFMGEQRIHLTDKTTPRGGQDFCISNHGTWFDVGAGFQAGVTDDLYAFGDVEYRFGNDLERTWIFNIGAKYRF